MRIEEIIMARVLFCVLALLLGGNAYGAWSPSTACQDEEEDFLVAVANISPTPSITVSKARSLLNSALVLAVKKGADSEPHAPTEEEESWLVKSGTQSAEVGSMIPSGSTVTVIIIPPPDWTLTAVVATVLLVVVIVTVVLVVRRSRDPGE